MKITVLDVLTLGPALDLSPLRAIGTVDLYESSTAEEAAGRIKDSDVVLINKVKLNALNLCGAFKLKLICIFATGYDNVDTVYCREHGIAVCNVKGYSTQSVAQLTVSMALSLYTRLSEYTSYVNNGSYSASGIPNRLEPLYHEIYGKTWGVVGYGNIGRQVGRVAGALGCKVLVNKRTAVAEAECVSLERLMTESDIISIHTPLSDTTRGLISRDMLSLCKKEAVVINVARGAVWDEEAVADAVLEGRLAGIGCDVYSPEPFPASHPMTKITGLPNVILTPHMAWGAIEARERCLEEIILNIKSFFEGGNRNRVV